MEYKVNGSLSINNISEEFSVAACNGYYKILNCDNKVLQEVLECVRETNGIYEVYKRFEGKYSEEEISTFLNVLIDEKLILKEEIRDEILKVKIAVLGDQDNISIFKKMIPDEIDIVQVGEINSLDKVSKDRVQCVVVLPGKAAYSEIINLNKVLMKSEIPFVLVRFTGDEFIIGPFVFPKKGTCLECHIMQHLNLINKESQEKVMTEDLKPLKFSEKWGGYFTPHEVHTILDKVISDIKQLALEISSFDLFENEIIFKRGQITNPQVRTYVITTDCQCCRGMNDNFSMVRHSKLLDIPTIRNPLNDESVKYLHGGLRSKTAEETNELISKALNSMGVEIEITEDKQNPLLEIVPVYDSFLRKTHRNKTPYYYGTQLSHGKGINEQQARFSAAFEIMERLSSRYFGEKPIIRGKVSDLRVHCMDITEITKIVGNIETAFDSYNEDLDIDWVWGYSLVDDKPKLIPADITFLNNCSFRGVFNRGGSSGLSAGATLQDAIFQGLLEVIEHDAWMIAQANTMVMPQVMYDNVQNKELLKVINQIKDMGYEIITRDYTNDIGIPVFRTWIINPKDYMNYGINGFGASVYPEIALERSITEAIQARGVIEDNEEVKNFEPIRTENMVNYRNSLFKLFYFKNTDMCKEGPKKDISDYEIPKFDSVGEATEYVINKIKAVVKDADILFVDLTRDSIGIPAVKVLVSKGLQVFGKPILNPTKRLLDFQKNMGYSNEAMSYEDLYLGDFPH